MSPVNLNKMCRICGEIFKDRFETVEDHEKEIIKYLPIKDKDNGFPKNLCTECLSSIVTWNVFYQRCEETQKKFATLLKRTIVGSAPDSKYIASPLLSKEPADVLYDDEENQMITAQNDLNLSCNFCAGHPMNQQQLNEHLIAAHCDLIFCCDLCKNCKPRDELITHMTEHALSSLQTSSDKNSPIDEKFHCTKCERHFVTKSGLKYHMISNHTIIKQFACNECEHTFPCKRVLVNHFRSVHSKDKIFKCNKCDKCFKTDSTLYAHNKTHSKEAPYKCYDCAKGFKFKHHLDLHSLQHKAKERKFECSCCHKKFAAQNNLTKHRKIHDRTTDFVCHICGVKTVQKRYLRDHMKRVHQTRLDSLESLNVIC